MKGFGTPIVTRLGSVMRLLALWRSPKAKRGGLAQRGKASRTRALACRFSVLGRAFKMLALPKGLKRGVEFPGLSWLNAMTKTIAGKALWRPSSPWRSLGGKASRRKSLGDKAGPGRAWAITIALGKTRLGNNGRLGLGAKKEPPALLNWEREAKVAA